MSLTEIIMPFIIWFLKAFICSLPGFFISFFVELKIGKHIIFFICALGLTIASIIFHPEFLQNTLGMEILNFFYNLFGIYLGLFLLISIKNMFFKNFSCPLCEKLRQKLRIK